MSSKVNSAGGPWDSDRMSKGSVAQKRLRTTDVNGYQIYQNHTFLKS